MLTEDELDAIRIVVERQRLVPSGERGRAPRDPFRSWVGVGGPYQRVPALQTQAAARQRDLVEGLQQSGIASGVLAGGTGIEYLIRLA